MMRRAVLKAAATTAMTASVFLAACGGKKPPVAKPLPPPPPPPGDDGFVAAPVAARAGPRADVVPPEPVNAISRNLGSGSLDDLNRNSPLKPVFFDYDSSELSPAAKTALDENAGVLKKYGTWVADHRRPLRRARDGRVQSGIGRTARRRGARLPGLARRRGRPAAHRQLRQGISVRPGSRRGRVCEKPARAFRHHRGKVKTTTGAIDL